MSNTNGFRVIRSRRRTLALEITRQGEVLVRAPLRASNEAISRFVNAHQNWLEKHLTRRKEYLAAHPEPTPEQAENWKNMAQSRLPDLVSRWAGEMGVNPCGIRVTAARTRFGSCSAKGRLCFSLYLMAYPDAAIEYVVVHELAHLRHHDHSPAFYAEVEKYLPDWRQRRELLRR